MINGLPDQQKIMVSHFDVGSKKEVDEVFIKFRQQKAKFH